MQRRSFLKTVATAVPAAGLQTFLVNQARAQTPALPPSSEPHVVWSREGPFRSSPLVRVQLHSLQSPDQRDGRRPLRHGAHTFAAGRAAAAPSPEPGGMVLPYRGTLVFQVGEQRLQLHAGESLLAPRRVPHTFSSVGEAPSRMLIAFCPAGKMEQYFRDAENDKTSAGSASFMRRYEMELVGPSPFWKS